MADAQVIRDRKGPTDWPEEWGSESPPTIARLAIVVFGFGFVLAVLAALSGSWAIGIALAVVSALLVALGVLLLHRREPNFSDAIDIADLDPLTGAANAVGSARPASGEIRGVRIPFDNRTVLTGVVIGLLVVAISPMVGMRIAAIGDSGAWTIVGAVAAVALGGYGLLYIAQFAWVRSTQPKIVLAAEGLWYNNATTGAFVPWSALTTIGTVGRAGRSGPPVIALTVAESVRQIPLQPLHFMSNVVRTGSIQIPATALVLDGALLLKFVQLLRADETGRLRQLCPDPGGVLHEIEEAYARWHTDRTA